MTIKNAYIFITAALLLASFGRAITVDNIQINSSNPWIEQVGENSYAPASILISVQCSENNVNPSDLSVSGIITYKSLTYQPKDFVYDSETDLFKLNYQTTTPGIYSINITCSYNSSSVSELKEFEVKKLTGDIILPPGNPPYSIYVGQNFETPVEVELFVESNTKTSPLNPTFKVYLEQFGQKYQLSGEIAFDQNTQHFIINPFVSSEYSELDTSMFYNLLIDIEYFDAGEKHSYEIIKRNVVKIQSPLELHILDVNDGGSMEYATSGALTIHYSMFYNKNIIQDLDQSDFFVYLVDEDGKRTANLEIANFSYNTQTGTGYIKAKLPQYEPGVYRLFLASNYMPSVSGVLAESKRPVKFILPFSGKIVDANNRAVGGKIRLTKDGETKEIMLGNMGEYFTPVLPGNYTMVLQFGALKATLKGVYIKSGINDAIRFDSFSGHEDIPGISVASLVVLEIASDLEFSGADLQIYYNASKVADEQRIEVYTCHNWNFDRRLCSGEWERIDKPIIDTTTNMVQFNVSAFSAFVIGERKSLHFDANIVKKDYFMGDTIPISGKVLDSNGNPIEDASVYASLGSVNESAKTDIGGFFTINLKAPMYEGSLKLTLRAEKDPFLPTESSVFIDLSRKTELSILSPETIDISEGKTNSVNITIENTGQTNLSDITVSIEGIPSEWYQLIPTTISAMNPKDSDKVTLKVLVPAGYCSSHECKKFYLINVVAKSKETKIGTTTVLQFVENTSTAGDEETNTPTGFLTKLKSTPTAMITSFTDFLNTGWWIVLIIIIIVFGFLIKNKKNRTTGYKREPSDHKYTRERTINKIRKVKAKVSHEFKYRYK